MSNYPPGVTGNEPQIAGYPEQEIEAKCGQTDIEYSIEDDNGKIWPVIIDCPWEGKVEAVIDLWMAYWTCPLCKSDNETEMEEAE